MNSDLHSQMFNELDLKDTEELVSIWQENNHDEWTDEAFAIIQEILLKRLGELPPQFEQVDELDEEESDDQPIFFKPNEVYKLVAWLDRAAIIIVGLGIFGNILGYSSSYNIVNSFFLTRADKTIVWIFTLIYMLINVVVTGLIYYFGFRGFASVLRILLAMEENSRKAQP